MGVCQLKNKTKITVEILGVSQSHPSVSGTAVGWQSLSGMIFGQSPRPWSSGLSLGRRFTEGPGKPHSQLCPLGLCVKGHLGGQTRNELIPLLTLGTPLWSLRTAGTGVQVLMEYGRFAGELAPTSGLLAFDSPGY